MKNYKQILEAINRGILLALDDFEDEEQVLNIKSKQVLNRDYTKEYLDLLRDEVVDLGLPSGTLWCKYNLGVNPNLLSKPEDWYGDYYAWGELEEKTLYSLSNYKYGEYADKTKYCEKDGLIQLLPEDDAAYQFKKYHNFKFRIPTKELFNELLIYTNNYWINNYDPNKLIHNSKNAKGIYGLNGRVFEGKNGNLIFIPASGSHYRSDLIRDRISVHLWSSNLNLKYTDYAYNLYLDSDDDEENIEIASNERCYGFPIRPVIKL